MTYGPSEIGMTEIFKLPARRDDDDLLSDRSHEAPEGVVETLTKRDKQLLPSRRISDQLGEPTLDALHFKARSALICELGSASVDHGDRVFKGAIEDPLKLAQRVEGELALLDQVTVQEQALTEPEVGWPKDPAGGAVPVGLLRVGGV
jgi:hypothetical protein